jgi:phosphopantothenoylcysteine decarboxylase/phosphopantothenate--cysteine ligase
MNVNMWEHPATRENLETLRKRGARIVEPDSGYLACGMVGAGRLAPNEVIVNAVMEALGPQDLAGETILITAGPTREPIDPVRYISNRSSGKMGYALAEAALRRGARVILITGPTALNPPDSADVVRVETAEEMYQAVMKRLPEASILIGAAAVGDYRPKTTIPRKIKREAQGPLVMALEPTTDIIAEVAEVASQKLLVIGFAAETNDVMENARRKLSGKHLHAIVVNDVACPGIGFDSDRNAVTIITPTEETVVPETSKLDVAGRILDAVRRLRQQQTVPQLATPY